jgi:hypothetical protein
LEGDLHAAVEWAKHNDKGEHSRSRMRVLTTSRTAATWSS